MKVGDRVVVRGDGADSVYGGEPGTVKELRDSGPFDLLVKLDDRTYDRLFSSDEVEKLEEA